MRALKPKAYIKETPKTAQYECSICNYIAEKPYTCRGPCGQNFCFQCVNCIKKNNDHCPFRCSSPFDLQEGKEPQLEFRCPFEPQKCKELIMTLSQFYSHADKCSFVPPGWKQKEENFRRYRCDKGHDLFFMDQKDLTDLYGWQFYEQPTNSICSSCGDKGLCRSICPKCSVKNSLVLFCTNCRKPPCTKLTCLYEHNLQKQNCQNAKGLICDFCGTAAYLLGPNAFRDVRCNFDICEVCFINLPDKHELVPFKTPKNVIDHLRRKSSNHMEGYQGQHDLTYYLQSLVRNRNESQIQLNSEGEEEHEFEVEGEEFEEEGYSIQNEDSEVEEVEGVQQIEPNQQEP